jgi:signal transduction histidine kinase
MERLSREMIASFSPREEHVRALQAADFKSVIAVPLLAYGRLGGVITLISSSSSPRFGPADVRLAEELAQRVALSTENARLFDEAQRAVRTRDEVLAVVAHDLGNPLAAIALMANSLRRFERSDRSKFEGFIEEIVRSVDHTLLLIEDLLSFARIQSGTFSVTKKVDTLSPVLMRIAERMTVQAEAKRQKLEVDLFSNLSNVAIDARRMSQVLSNLIGNAIKFTPEGGTIRVSARQQGHEIVVSVTDTGPGIPPEHLSKVFDRFWQAQAAGYTGSGLGLSIAKGIVEAHGGRIWAESEVGQGSSFRFSLPAVDLELPQTGSAA